MLISIITPAHNEEAHLGKCATSAKRAAEFAAVEFEHVVVLNRCTDKTETIAVNHGCRTLHDDTRNLSHLRNRGAAAAHGNVLVTIDADSWMSANMLSEVIRLLKSDRYIGGGVLMYPERWSLGIVCSLMVVAPYVIRHRVSAGMFWCYKRDFDVIGGFDESLNCIEDLDFGRRLKSYGRAVGKTYGTVCKAHLMTSCRKFDQFGDWYFVRNPRFVVDLFDRKQEAADAFYYDARK